MCLPEWRGGDNGGATYQGVTGGTIKVVALVPNEQQAQNLTQRPVDYTTGGPGSVQDALADACHGVRAQSVAPTPMVANIELEFVVSSGDDEAAQHADALAVKEREPFAVLTATWAAHRRSTARWWGRGSPCSRSTSRSTRPWSRRPTGGVSRTRSPAR